MPPPQNWSDVPDLLLLSIVRRLSTFLDFFAFAGVCRSWRSFLRSSATNHYLSARPPLLFIPKIQSLQTLDQPPSTFISPIPSSFPSLLCLGYSYGHLILLRRVDRAHHQPILSDALTGSRIQLPALPPNRFPYYYAALTAPPSSPHSVLLLVYSQYHFLYLRLAGGPHWSTHHLDPAAYITHVIPFKNRQVLAINDRADKLLKFDFDQELRAEVFNVKGITTKATNFDRLHFGPQLIECGGELLLVLFVKNQEQRAIVRIDVYRLDFERMLWVEVKELCDYALFIDCGGRCPVSCYKPERWGGRSNCAYLAGPGYDSWKEFPLGDAFIADLSKHSPLSLSNFYSPRWPSPIWVYPSLFF